MILAQNWPKTAKLSWQCPFKYNKSSLNTTKVENNRPSACSYVFFTHLLRMEELNGDSVANLPSRRFYALISGVSPPDVIPQRERGVSPVTSAYSEYAPKNMTSAFYACPRRGWLSPLTASWPHHEFQPTLPSHAPLALPLGPSKGLSTLHHLWHHPDVIVTSTFLEFLLVAILNKLKRWMWRANLATMLLGDINFNNDYY